MYMRTAILMLSIASAASAGIVKDVRDAIARGDFAGGDAAIASYRKEQGLTPEMLEAQSWLGRGALAAKKLDASEAYAKGTLAESAVMLKQRPLDSERYLPIAVGAAIEVEGQVLAARGRRANTLQPHRRPLRPRACSRDTADLDHPYAGLKSRTLRPFPRQNSWP